MPQSFTQRFTSLPVQNGYQFEFYCDHCQKPFRSSFKPATFPVYVPPQNEPGKVKGFFSGLANEVGSVVENGFNTIGSNQPQQNRPQAQQELDRSKAEYEAAFQDAQLEVSQNFARCPKCGSWVCIDCWDHEAGTCSRCVSNSRYAAVFGGNSPAQAPAPQQQAASQLPPAAAAAGGAAAATGGAAAAAAIFSGRPASAQPEPAVRNEPPAELPPAQPSSPTVTCPRCGHETPELPYCGWCGKPATPTRECRACGKQVDSSNLFCGYCGKKLDPDKKTCPACGFVSEPEMLYCGKCGTKLDPDEEKPKEPVVKAKTEIAEDTAKPEKKDEMLAPTTLPPVGDHAPADEDETEGSAE